jgi:hypothetical protein
MKRFFQNYSLYCPHWAVYDPGSLIDPTLIVSDPCEDTDYTECFVEAWRQESLKGSLILLTSSGATSTTIYVDEAVDDYLTGFLDSSTTDVSFLSIRSGVVAFSSIATVGGRKNDASRVYIENLLPGCYKCEFSRLFKCQVHEHIDSQLRARFAFQHSVTGIVGRYGCLSFLVGPVLACVSWWMRHDPTFVIAIMSSLLLGYSIWAVVKRSSDWSPYLHYKRELEEMYPDSVIQLSWSEDSAVTSPGKKGLMEF